MVYSSFPGIVALELFTGELNCDRDKAAYGKVAERKSALPADKPVPNLIRRLLEEDPGARITARAGNGYIILAPPFYCD